MAFTQPPSPGNPKPDRADREAVRWVSEQESGLLDAAGAARLDAWLEVPRNAQAFARARALWSDMGEAVTRPDPAGALPAAQPAQRVRRATTASNGRRWTALAATGLAATIALAAIGLDLPTRLQADAFTQPGEQRVLTLDDGSTIQLNTDSAVDVAYEPGRRTVRLLRGEAAFSVAPDAGRPFIVEAGGGSITALGTRFLVRRRGSATQVSVTEHAVRASSQSGSVVVNENHTSTFEPHQIPTTPTASLIGIDAWTDGWLVFEDQPLSLVVAEIARYSSSPMSVVGRSVRNRRVSGAFRIDQPGQTVARLEQTLGVRATRLIGGAVIIHD